MERSRPDPSWLPLREGVLRFQHSLECPDWKPEELVQALCDLVCGETGIRIEYVKGTQKFEVLIEENGAPHVRLGSFKIGDIGISVDSFGQQLIDGNKVLIDNVIAALNGHLERLLKIQLERSTCQLFARLGSTTAHFEEVPPDIFGHYKIVDWRHGAAEASSGERLFSIHLAEPMARIAGQIDPEAEALKPRVSDEPEAKPRVSNADLKRCYAEYVNRNRDVRPPPSRDADVEYIRSMFPTRHIALQRVYSLRKELAPEHWKARGRRRVRSGKTQH